MKECSLIDDRGAAIHGICIYPIVNHPGWDDDRHCYNGLWDYADEHGKREIYTPLAVEIEKEAEAFRHPATAPTEFQDGRDLDLLDQEAKAMAEASDRSRDQLGSTTGGS